MAATYDNSVDYTEESVRKIIVSRGFEPRKLSVEDLCSKVMFIRRARSLPENDRVIGDIDNFLKLSRKFECISCLFPWELEQDSEYDFCRLCCVLDIMTIIFKYDGELTCGIRPGVPTGKEIYKKITAYNNGLNSERFPRDKKGRITLDKIEKGLDWRIKLFGLHQDENVEKCPCCGCVNGVLKKCGRCRIVYYCSKMCQSIHWKIHQRNCVESCEKILEKKK